jgi:hypothetical protein
MLRKICLITALSLVSFLSYSGGNEEEEQNAITDRMFFGGNLGLSFGTNFTVVNLSPIVGYRVTDRLGVGAGPIYQYTRIKDYGFNRETVTTNNYGFNTFARYALFNPFFAQVEYEYLNFEFVEFDLDTFRDDYSSLFLGGGVNQSIGGNAAFSIIVLYNVLYNDDEFGPYNSPLVVRGGVTVGF